MNWFRQQHDSLTLNIYVQPGAKQNSIAGLHGESLKIRLTAAAIDGRANEAVVKYLATLFKVPQRQVKITQGQKSRWKVIVISGSHFNPTGLLPPEQ